MHHRIESAERARIPMQVQYYQLRRTIRNLCATRRIATHRADPPHYSSLTPQRLPSRSVDCRLGVAGSRVVRDSSLLGAQSGWVRRSCTDVIGLKAIGVVRADRVLRRKSSKRVQCEDPIWKASVHDKSRHLLRRVYGQSSSLNPAAARRAKQNDKP
jgi:hypothetical protein